MIYKTNQQYSIDPSPHVLCFYASLVKMSFNTLLDKANILFASRFHLRSNYKLTIYY